MERERVEIKSVTAAEVEAVAEEMKEVIETVTAKVAESMRMCESDAKKYAQLR